VYALLRYVKIRHASSTLLGYDHELWRIQFTTKAQSNEGERSSSRVKDLTAEEIREGCSRLNPSLQTFFKFLVFTGMRAEQAYDVLKSWKPERVERFTRTIEGEKIAYARYATSDFSRGKKNSFYAIFPAALLKEIEGYSLPGAVDSLTLQIRRAATQDKARPINASNLRKFNVNMLRKGKAVDPDVAEYIQGRRPKGVGADRYVSLKDLAVEQYPIALHRNFGPDFFGGKAPATKEQPKRTGHENLIAGKNKNPMDEKELDRMLRAGMSHAQIIKTLPGANKTKIAAYVKAHPELQRK